MVKLGCLIVVLGICANLSSCESGIAVLDASVSARPAVQPLPDTEWPPPPKRHHVPMLGEATSQCKTCQQMSEAYGIVHHTVGQPPAWGRATNQAKGCWISMDCNMSRAKLTSAHQEPRSAPGLNGFFGNRQPTHAAPPRANEPLEPGQISEIEASRKPVDAPLTSDTMNGVIDWEKIAEETMFSAVQVRIVGQPWDWSRPQEIPAPAQWSGTAWFIAHIDIGDGTIVQDPEELLLVTNAHVAADALYATIMVPTAGSHPIGVDVLGTCVARDLALLRVKDPAQLRSQINWNPAMLRLGDSDKMKRAGQVMVLGYPLGLSGVKASMGFVSGYQQFEEELYLQVTAPIDGGNSGGPLLDEFGEVVGVVSAKIAQASGMSFAIPAGELKALLHVLYARRSVHLPMIGFDTPTVTSRHLREYFAIQDDADGCVNNQSGLLIDSVAPSSLFSSAGMQPGDVLLSLDGVSVDRYSQVWVEVLEDRVHMKTFLARKPFLDVLELNVWRGSDIVHLEVPYDSTPELAVPHIPETVNMRPYSASLAGVSMMNLTYNILETMFNARLAKFVQPEERLVPHVVVVGVDADSPAGIDGSISAGYLVHQVNGQQVSSLDQVCHAMVSDNDWVTIHTDCGMIIFTKDEVMQHECGNSYPKPDRLCSWPCPESDDESEPEEEMTEHECKDDDGDDCIKTTATRQSKAKQKEATESLAKAGTAKQKASTAKQKAGTAKQKAGTAKQKAGTAKQKASTAKQKAGTVKQKASTVKEKAGTVKQKAGTVKQKAGTVKARVLKAERVRAKVAQDVTTNKVKKPTKPNKLKILKLKKMKKAYKMKKLKKPNKLKMKNLKNMKKANKMKKPKKLE